MKPKLNSSPDFDRGWAFMIFLCTLLNLSFTYGFSYSNSVFYAIFLDEFQESPVSTSWAVNLNLFCSLAFGFLGHCLLVTVGPRITTIIGCFLSLAGTLISSLVNSTIGISVTYGIITGTGFAFVILTSLSMIPLYFKKYRVIASSVASIGVGLGQFVYTPVIRFLVDKYHWRGAVIILGGINLNMLVAAAAFMPPREGKVEMDSSKEVAHHPKKKNAADILRKLVSDLQVFRDPLWILYCFGRTAILMSSGGFLTHIYNFGRQTAFNFTSLEVTFLPPLIGIGGMTGRLLVGPLTYYTNLHVVLEYLLINFLIVIVSVTVSLSSNYVIIAVCCFFAGISLGGNALIFEVIIHIVGLERYSSGLSYSMLFTGLGLLLGGPFAAWIYEIDPSYVWSFRMIGMLMFLGIVLNIPSFLTVVDGKICQRPSMDETLKRVEDRLHDKERKPLTESKNSENLSS